MGVFYIFFSEWVGKKGVGFLALWCVFFFECDEFFQRICRKNFLTRG